MLYEDLTTGALMYGYAVDAEGMSEDDLTTFNSEISASGLTLFVPGDTVHIGFEQFYLDGLVLGVPIIMVMAWDRPTAVTMTHVKNAQDALARAKPALDKLAAAHDLIAQALKNQPSIYLTCCGPLPYAALSCGEIHPSNESSDAQYQFHSQQDMDQQWHEYGVDGVSIANVEFSDAIPITLNPTQLDQWMDRVPLKTNPQLFMTVRYD